MTVKLKRILDNLLKLKKLKLALNYFIKSQAMLTNLKHAIRKKKLHFVIKSSSSNIKQLKGLLKNNIISGFFCFRKNKQTDLIAYINYNYSFQAAISSVSKIPKKVTLQSNKNIDSSRFNSNFILNIKFDKNLSSHSTIKFR